MIFMYYSSVPFCPVAEVKSHPFLERGPSKGVLPLRSNAAPPISFLTRTLFPNGGWLLQGHEVFLAFVMEWSPREDLCAELHFPPSDLRTTPPPAQYVKAEPPSNVQVMCTDGPREEDYPGSFPYPCSVPPISSRAYTDCRVGLRNGGLRV